MKKLIVSSIICFIFFGCFKTAEELTLDRLDYFGSEVRIDGYFYYSNESFYTTFLLYNNGVYLDIGGFSNVGSLIDLDSRHTSDENCKNLYYCWGVYQVEGDKIKIERWQPGSGGPYPTQLLEGDIVNDETIRISGLRGTEYENELDEFRFRHLSPKPDSTNTFIE